MTCKMLEFRVQMSMQGLEPMGNAARVMQGSEHGHEIQGSNTSHAWNPTRAVSEIPLFFMHMVKNISFDMFMYYAFRTSSASCLFISSIALNTKYVEWHQIEA